MRFQMVSVLIKFIAAAYISKEIYCYSDEF